MDNEKMLPQLSAIILEEQTALTLAEVGFMPVPSVPSLLSNWWKRA